MTRFSAALTLATAVVSFSPIPLVAQTQPPGPAAGAAGQAAPGAAYIDTTRNAQQLREQFRDVLARYPRSVGSVLRLDPRLFGDADYLASYPALAQFVAQHPEVTRNPDYYLAGYGSGDSPYSNRDPRAQAMDVFRNFLEGMTILFVIATISAALLWLIKAIVDHRRWLRVSKIQTEVHTKLLDRFSSSDELLAYMKTPAGSRFLESAPIMVDAGASPRAVSAPLNRILWSAQAGVVLVLAGAGLIVARHQVMFEEVRAMIYMLGIFGSFIGIGFLLSALASWVLSRRLGLLEGTPAGAPPSVSSGRVDSSGL